jgi:hypothetical protein
MDPLSLTAFLAPYLPYLMKGAQDLTEELGRKLGQEAWKHAKAMWARLRPGVEGNEATRAAADAVASNPEDEVARGGLAFQLKALLEGDSQLATELARLWKEAEEAKVVNVVTVGDRGVGFVGSVTDSVISTGDQASIEK